MFHPPVSSLARRVVGLWAMATLQNHRGQPLVDADGQEIKAGSIVVDAMFGQGIALEHGDGINVRDPKQPPSRSADNLKLASGGRMRTTRYVEGAAFESGAAHRAQGVNDLEAE